MKSFKYKAYTLAGAHQEGFVEASSKVDAAKELAKKGLKPYFVDQGAASRAGTSSGSNASHRFRLTHGENSKFFNGVSVLLTSGFELDEALSTSLEIENNSKLKKCLQAVRQETQKGESFAQALETQLHLPGFAIAIVRSAEQTGDLKTATVRLAEVFEGREKVRNEILSAITYPIFLLCLLIIILVLLAVNLVPTLTPLFADSATPLPPLLSFLLTFGELISRYAFLLIGALTVFFIAFFHPRSKAWLKAAITNLARRLPWVGGEFRRAMSGRYLRTLATLITSNIPLPDALALSAMSLHLLKDKESFSAAQRSVLEGEQLSSALETTGLLDAYVISLIAIGERSDTLGTMIERSADIVETNVKTTLNKFLGALSPTLTVLIGLIVGSLVVSVMTALLSLNEAVLP